ncbi:hypothetical protein PFZ49_07975 [Microbacterium lacticum]|uniref:hypothetical protein n=1 Tax=Microbacterium lacticum TaxID=33885 RepID=UPI003A841F2E
MWYLLDLIILVIVGLLAYLVNGYVSAAVMVIVVAGVLIAVHFRRHRGARPEPMREGSSNEPN